MTKMIDKNEFLEDYILGSGAWASAPGGLTQR